MVVQAPEGTAATVVVVILVVEDISMAVDVSTVAAELTELLVDVADKISAEDVIKGVVVAVLLPVVVADCVGWAIKLTVPKTISSTLTATIPPLMQLTSTDRGPLPTKSKGKLVSAVYETPPVGKYPLETNS